MPGLRKEILFQPTTPISSTANTEVHALPVFKGTAKERLMACLVALGPSQPADRPTMGTSRFAENIRRVSKFAENHLSTKCPESKEEYVPVALYVCGVPGTGKTYGVEWCCRSALSCSNEDDGAEPKLCIVNASEKSLEDTLTVLASALGIRICNRLNQNLYEKVVASLKKSKSPVLLVIDEIDLFISARRCKSHELEVLLQLANDSNNQLALIGISNSMNDDTAHEIQGAGDVSNPSGIFLTSVTSN